MENSKKTRRPSAHRDQSMTEVFAKYKNILWEKKYWILIVTLGFTLLWVMIYSLLLSKQLEYQSSATLKFDDPRMRTVSAVTDIAEFSLDGKVAILYTNSFLLQVVDSLRLNLVLYTPGINRFELFKKIEVSEEAKFGDYKIVSNEEGMNVFYSNDRDDIKDLNIYSGEYPKGLQTKLLINGLNLTLDTQVLRENEKIDFGYNPRLVVANNLRKKMMTSLDRSRTILTLTFSHRHPESSAIITNTIADLFIENLLNHKRFRTSSILISLEDQLRTADQSLKESEAALRKFRERNPYLLLSDAGSNIVEELSGSESELTLIKFKVEKLQSLMQQKAGSDKNLAYMELISFWEEENGSTDHIITTQYGGFLDDRSALIAQNYTADHPRILEIDDKLANLEKEIDNRVRDYSTTLISRQKTLQRQVNRGQRNLRRLPSGEMQLAELQQNRSVNAEIYSTILVRFNEAKISDASIISDAFIIDRAEAPVIYRDVYDALKVLIVGPILGLLISIGFFIFKDFLDDTVKKREEVEQVLRIPVLSSIPVIFDEKEIPDDINIKGQLDYKLITSDYSPTIAGEKFRLLRTKMLSERQGEHKTFILTSLQPGDGKSLIAANLAITFAQQKISTLLIDADLRRGVQHNSFNCNKKPGLSDMLASNKDIDNDEIFQVIQKSHVPYLSLLTCGTQIPNPSELLGGTQMKSLLEQLQGEFDVLIFDTPPIEYIPDALVLDIMINNIILVVRYGKTHLNKLSDKVFELTNIRNDFRGVIINASQEKTEKDQYSYPYYHY